MTAKKLFQHILMLMIYLTIDAAIIHNAFWTDRWNIYAERTIMIAQIFYWIALVLLIPTFVLLALRDANPRRHYEYKDTYKRADEAFAPSFYKRVYFWVNSVPMTIFAGIFAGRPGLSTCWTLLIIADVSCRHYRKEFYKKLDAGEVADSPASSTKEPWRNN